MTTIWITGSKAPSLVSRIPAMGQPVNPWPDSFFVAGNPPKRISPAYRSNTYALAALAVGGKLTKRVLGSFACLGDGARSGRVLAGNRPGDVTRRLPGCRMTRPNRGKVEVCLFPNNATQSRCRGKGVPLTLCYVNHLNQERS